MAHLYHVPSGSRLLSGETVVLEGDEAHHAARVGRLRVGERIFLGDGRGTLAQAEATAVNREQVQLVVVDVAVHHPLLPELVLVQSLAKGGRDEQAIEMATEVGVSRIVPLHADRSVVKWDGSKAESGQQRWQRIVKEASKQSLQAFVPVVEAPATLDGILGAYAEDTLLVLDHRGDPLSHYPVAQRDPNAPVVVVVGPEGGFSDQEREAFDVAGASIVRLGPGVLRTSSAGPIALAILHEMLGHWTSEAPRIGRL